METLTQPSTPTPLPTQTTEPVPEPTVEPALLPSPEPTKTPKPPMNQRKKLLLVIVSVLLGLPVLIVLSLVVIIAILNNTGGPSAEEIKSASVKPAQKSAFLDNRYATGTRAFKVKEQRSRFAGATSDGKTFATWSMRDSADIMYDPSNPTADGASVVNGRIDNELRFYDVATEKLKSTLKVEQCSDINTSDDTIICSLFIPKDGNRKGKHVLTVINVETGKSKFMTEPSMKPITKIQRLGKNNGATVLYVEQQDSVFAPTDQAIVAVEENGAVRYGLNFVGDSPECSMTLDNSTVLCKYRTETVGARHKVLSISAKDGKELAKVSSANEPIITSDGWVVETTDYSQGISVSESGKPTVSYAYDSDGTKTEEENYPADLIPAPRAAGDSSVSYSNKDMLSQIRYEKYVVNQNGNVILRKKLLTSSRETEDTYLRASDNKIAFKGSPLGITLDAKTVLAINGDRYASKEYTIYDISTGAKLQEFQTRTTSAQVILSHGMFYVEETGNTVIYLPGK